jgi:hypothetical protein
MTTQSIAIAVLLAPVLATVQTAMQPRVSDETLWVTLSASPLQGSGVTLIRYSPSTTLWLVR